MDWLKLDWLKGAIVELFTSLFNYVFNQSKHIDAADSGKFEKDAKEKLKKEGW